MQIAENLKVLQTRITNVITTRQALSSHCRLVAVSKTKPIDDILAAYEGGQR
jgi:uncharacterized pyridoxal phosphate-containing UPF0001 family protein